MAGCLEAARMKLLGAVLAGGRSRRFGSDKAEALYDGRRLLDHAAAALHSQCDAVVVVGRQDAAHVCVPDRPGPGLGPLGGLAGALAEADCHGFDLVLSCSVDNVALPPDLIALLSPAPALLARQPTVGLWPPGLLPRLLAFIDADPVRSLRGFAAHTGARFVASPVPIPNINRPADLARLGPRKR
ncbi:molybdenum cofactor guanylyltransferase [Novosphingopyxis sp.]|uniref:molybdenum cofactor guanylyltransferase n=1 Tax=Novosphingopyxis sp. TaxID=2709690 RepID=UPI003B5BCADD